MTILEMIAEWRKGCGNTMTDDGGNIVEMNLHPEKCTECTLALIAAIERAARGGVIDLRMGNVPFAGLERERPELFVAPGERAFGL